MRIRIDRIKILSTGFSRERMGKIASNLGRDLSEEVAGRRDFSLRKGKIVIPSLTLESLRRNDNESASDFGARLAGRIYSAVMDQNSDNKGKGNK